MHAMGPAGGALMIPHVFGEYECGLRNAFLRISTQIMSSHPAFISGNIVKDSPFFQPYPLDWYPP